MGYLPKELILKAYKTLSMLTEDHKQGQTQITSYLRHLLAFDMYYKEKGDDCDLDDEENRNAFTKNVKRIVNIVDGYYTTNFYTNIKELDDCGVGSNFYSAGVVNNSKQNKSYTYDYPTRGQYPLFKVRSNKLIREESYFKNVNAYLKTQEIKCAFVIWVLRDRYIDELSALLVKSGLQRIITKELVEAIMPIRLHLYHAVVARRCSILILQFLWTSHKCQFTNNTAFACTRYASKQKERLSTDSSEIFL